jgi:hypothetical protein
VASTTVAHRTYSNIARFYSQNTTGFLVALRFIKHHCPYPPSSQPLEITTNLVSYLLMATMPARQHPPSSEVALSSSPTSPHPRSSLRRLSSLANLHQFNPFNSFNRRRSSHSTQTSDDDPYLTNTYQQRSQDQQRRQTYVPLSEEPLPALPKSRTFSNLPLTRNRNNSKPPVSMKPPSRIPTPVMGSNAKTRLASATKSILKVGNRRGLVRSDTEPLLEPHRTHNVPSLVKPLGENVSLDVNTSGTNMMPIQLPEVPLRPLNTNARAFHAVRSPQTPDCQTSKHPPRRDSLQPPTPRTPVSTVHLGRFAQSPATVTAKPRRQTMITADAIPLHSLYDKEKQRSSFSSGIQSHRLLTPHAAPTLSPSSCPRPSSTYHRREDSANKINLASDIVTSAQSTAYWSGRLMAQFDQRRNEQLQARVGRSELGLTYPENDINLCLRELQKRCVTEAAKLSFAMFKARVYVKAGTLGTARGVVEESGVESRGKDLVEA